MTSEKNPVNLSIIITAHSEGLIAHKTMLSVERAIKSLRSAKISYEIIISIDNGSAETSNYFESYINSSPCQILKVNFKDLSASRNNAISKANGTYISFLDADDLISENWLKAGYEIAVSQNVVVHPEYSITFGDDNLLWRKTDSTHSDADTLRLIDNNLWDSPCIAHRDIFKTSPYSPNGNGFGFEDKLFNTQTLAKGIQHKVAANTILFVRRKITGSMLLGAVSDRVTVGPTDLFSYNNITKINLDANLNTEKASNRSRLSKVTLIGAGEVRRIAKYIHHHGKKYALYRNAVQPLREVRQKRIGDRINEQYPEWLIKEWRAIHLIDNSLFPGKELLTHLPSYDSNNTIPGSIYTKIVQSFKQEPDTLFFVPHLIKGGADMVFINYANELARTHKDWHISLLQTEPKESVWKDRVQEPIDFVDIHELMRELDQDTKYRLLATLITQNGIKRIIVGNSQLAYDFISQYQTLVRRLGIKIYCFAFGEEFDEEGRLWGHIHTGIPRIYPVVTRILTDNENTVNKLFREYHFDKERFKVHYQPTAVELKPIVKNTHKPIRVLWASRVCKQKRPDILKSVSSHFDDKEVIFDAYGELEEGLTESYFDDSKVRYRGSFDGVRNLPTQNYDIYLYTSEGDGVPNMLQEITASGLPIVASNVGGIKEFIVTGETGYLVTNHEDIESYVTAINELLDSSTRENLVAGARHLLTTKFARETWQESIKTDIY